MGGNNFHPFATNLHPRKSSGRRHVAGPVRNAGALGGLGTLQSQHRTPNISPSRRFYEAGGEHRMPNSLLVDLLYFARVRVSGEGADRMGTTVNGCDRAEILSSGTLYRAFQIRPRTFAHAGVGLPLGNSGACSYAR